MKSMQSILLVGANSRVGKRVLGQALTQGYRVTVLVNDPKCINGYSHHPHIEILKGSVVQYADVYNAIQGNDAVISTLEGSGRDPEVITAATANIIKAFRQSEASKFVCLSSFGSGSTRKLTGWQTRLLIWLTGLSRAFSAKAEQELMLYKSNVNFTLVMAGSLTDGTATEASPFLIEHATGRFTFRPYVARDAVAKFLLDQLTDRAWNRKTVCLL